MKGRELLSKTNKSYKFDIDSVDIDDEKTLDILEPCVREWWVNEFGEYVEENGGFFTPPQKEAIPHIHNRENTLVASPTGSGKTLSSFLSIINELYKKDKKDELGNSVYCLYISPLKSLANDIHRNLEVPLDGITALSEEEINIRHSIRHGDTSDKERSKMLDETPHILNTTPETLAILLNSPKFKKKLETVEYIIVDEIHSLAENKRGTHLSVSLERLQNMCNNEITRVGCSATVEPLDTIADFLVGMGSDGMSRECEIVDTRFVRDYNIQVNCPTDDLIHTDSSIIQERFYSQLHNLVQSHKNTLVFTNTRSGAERVLHNLRSQYDEYTVENSGCHHGSLSKDAREEIEQKLKTGEIDVVTTSTSLELGIDMPNIDLVVQVGSPKSVSSLLQRIGRAGHQLGQTVNGKLIVLDRDELVECSVMAKKAEEGFIDRIFIPSNAQDVATQQVYGMAINGPRPEAEIKSILQSAYPYRNYSDQDWEQLMKYMTAEYDGLEDKNVYAKIWRDTNDKKGGEYHYSEYEEGVNLIGKRGKMARVIYMTNIGTIPDSFTIDVFTRGTKDWVGELDEEYLNTLDKGDVFVLSGERYKYQYRRGSKAYAEPTNESPTVPSWFSERLPLSYDLGREIAVFQETFIEKLTSSDGYEDFFSDWPIDENSAKAITSMYKEQIDYIGVDSVSTLDTIPVEEYLNKEERKKQYFIHSIYGRKFNDGLSRLIAYRGSKKINANISVAVSDHGFSISVPQNKELDIKSIILNIESDEVREIMRESLDSTDLLKRYFRINATRALTILKHYKGSKKSAAQQQVTSEMLLGFAEGLDNFAVVEETYREIMEDKLAVEEIEQVIRRVNKDEIQINQKTVPTPSPRAFGLATLTASDTVLAEDQSQLLKDFHKRVTEEINKS